MNFDNWTDGKSYEYVIHIHNGRKSGLHFDIRINNDKNHLYDFATRKNPTLNNNETILLFQQKDHSKEWLNIEVDEKKSKEQDIDMFLIFDKGVVKIISNDIERVIISFMGDKMKGCFSIIPYRKYQYLFMKIPYKNCK